MTDPKIIPLEGESEITIDTDKNGNRVNITAPMPPATTEEIYPNPKEGETK